MGRFTDGHANLHDLYVFTAVLLPLVYDGKSRNEMKKCLLQISDFDF